MSSTMAEIVAINKEIYAKERDLIELKKKRDKLADKALSEFVESQLRANGFRGTYTQ